jgi:hypothetical protein
MWSVPVMDGPQNVELKKEIQQDLERLYPSGCEDYFINSDRQQILLSVLFVWSREHSKMSYRCKRINVSDALVFSQMERV